MISLARTVADVENGTDYLSNCITGYIGKWTTKTSEAWYCNAHGRVRIRVRGRVWVRVRLNPYLNPNPTSNLTILRVISPTPYLARCN